jgi:hypothetical protein
MEYPAMLYKGGVLSGDPANQRTVNDAEAELAAGGDGFSRWEKKGAQVAGKNSAGATEQAAFDKAQQRVPAAGKGKAAA